MGRIINLFKKGIFPENDITIREKPPMGENSPLHLLEKEGGKVILIDYPNANTFHYGVEMANNVPCLGKRTEEYPVKFPNGRMVRCRTWNGEMAPVLSLTRIYT